MEKLNVETIDVTKFYDFVERGIRVSGREVLDEVDDLYRELKVEEPENFRLKRVDVDKDNPKKLKDIYFAYAEVSPEFKAMAEVVIRYYLRIKDQKDERLLKYFESEMPGKDYLVARGLIKPFDADSTEVIRLGKVMDFYCEALQKCMKQSRMKK